MANSAAMCNPPIEAAEPRLPITTQRANMTHRHVQQLEQRRVRYSHGDPIFVEGTSGADLIDITVHDDLTVVRIENANGVTEDRYGMVSGMPLSRFYVYTYEGDDEVRLRGSVSFAYVSTGADDDTIRIGDEVRRVFVDAGEGIDDLDLSEREANLSGTFTFYGTTSGDGVQYLNYATLRAYHADRVDASVWNAERFDLANANHELIMTLGGAPRSEFVSVRVNLGNGRSHLNVRREPPESSDFEPIRALVDAGTGRHTFTGDLSQIKIISERPTIRGTTTPARSIAQDVLG
jgi:hypothetical protein